MSELKLVNMSEWRPRSKDPFGSFAQTNGYDLKYFQILTFNKYKYCIYGHGQHENHIMDWRGCNFFHGRLPLSPTFYTEDEAIEWLRFQVEGGAYYEGMILTGHHAGESLCMKGCDDRMVNDWINFSDLKEDKTNDS